MKKFEDFTYKRPELEEYKLSYNKYLEQFNLSKTATDAKEAYDLLLKLENEVSSMANLCSIRYSINMNDEFYKKEMAFWNENAPIFDNYSMEQTKVLLSSSFIYELKQVYPKTLFLLGENQIKTVSEKTLKLKQEENQLEQNYNDLIAKAKIKFDNQIYTLPQMGKFVTDSNREIRKTANEAVTNYFSENENSFDEIFSKMVSNRNSQAKILGFENYTQMSYSIRNRFGYNKQSVENYRKQVVEVVVPLAQKLIEKQALRIGIKNLQYYDLPLEFLDGNAKPLGSTSEKVTIAQKMYRELSKETGEFFDFMVNKNLLNLDSKIGKRSGGYCNFISLEKSPFIFANFNGTSGDVDVLTHEAGHAFQVYQSRNIENNNLIFPTMEAAEIFSMSMEFIVWDYMENFFKEKTPKYKYSHLTKAVKFLPYGVLVDHFQHEVYENPEWSAAQRKAAWRKLEKLYLPYKDYSQSPELEKGIFWYRQGHIFSVPFYYIDYTLAQVVAFQFWKRFNIDKDKTAWNDYTKITKFGGEKSFIDIVKKANLEIPFNDGVLEKIISKIETYLMSIDDSKL